MTTMHFRPVQVTRKNWNIVIPEIRNAVWIWRTKKLYQRMLWMNYFRTPSRHFDKLGELKQLEIQDGCKYLFWRENLASF